MSASFQVNQPAEFTINIGLTFHNGTVTVQPQVVQQQQQLQIPVSHHQQLQHVQQTRPLALPENSAAFNEILRGLNSLSIQSNVPQHATSPSHFLASINSQEPPAQLNQTKRRERAAQRPQPQPVGIPNVPDTESELYQRRERRAAADRDAARQRSLEVIIKAPPNARPVPGNVGSKFIRGSPAPPELEDQHDRETSETIFLEMLGEMDNDRRRRQPSSAAPDSPGASISSHASSSPPASTMSAPTPPYAGACSWVGSVAANAAPPAEPRRRRGRPPKVRTDGGAAAPPRAPQQTPGRSGIAGGRAPQLQPRPAPHYGIGMACDTADCGVGVADDFVSPTDLAEAVKVINRYTDTELVTPNEKGELLTHTFAREGNWAKLMALNMRWLSSASLEGIFISINTASSMGHTPIIEAVLQQNLKAVEFCCLFTSSSDVQLFRGLVESALLPNDDIFATIFRSMSHEIDQNGNPVKYANRFIDKPIRGWSFRNQALGSYAGLTLAQMLTLQSADTHPRLATLIGYGADPRRPIDSSAAETYRSLVDCVYLAAALSPAPFECLRALGAKSDVGSPFRLDADGESMNWCMSTICGRTDLSPSYKEQGRQQFGGNRRRRPSSDDVECALRLLQGGCDSSGSA